MEFWNEFLADLPATLAALGAIITLVINLVKYVKAAVKEKNWKNLVNLVLAYMEEAEQKFENGADKKQWVLAMIKASAEVINYDIDIEEVSELIDSLCDMSLVVNAPPEKDDTDSAPTEKAGEQ